MDISSADWAIRAAAFRQVRRLIEGSPEITSTDLSAGFQYGGERIPLVNPQRGIFKPRQMEALLSIKTVFPKKGAKIWYDDQKDIHKQIFAAEDAVEYSFMGTDPEAADNRWLREAMERQVPIIYFIGTSPGRYQAALPAFITDWDAANAKARVAFSDPSIKTLPAVAVDAAERRYALRLVKQRLHQASFREAVISAYNGRCAVSRLPEPLLLDAAHITADADSFGHPVVQNGIPLSKIHHAAFDSNLIGIDADYRIHVSDRLLTQKDGPLLESIKHFHLKTLNLPIRKHDYPDRDRLDQRFRQFKHAA